MSPYTPKLLFVVEFPIFVERISLGEVPVLLVVIYLSLEFISAVLFSKLTPSNPRVAKAV